MVNYLFLLSLFAALFLVFTFALSLFAFRYVFKPVAMSIILGASLAAYFMNSYGIVIDKGIVRNVLETDPNEVRELLTPRLFSYLLFLGLLPCLILSQSRLDYASPVKRAKSTLKLLSSGTLLLLVITLPFSKQYISFARNHRETRHLLNPTNFLYAVSSHIKSSTGAAKGSIQIGKDAQLRTTWQQRGKKSVVIFVLGEAARASNFSLNNYERNTNPRLKGERLINFTNFYSCDTATATSVPCLFSNLGRASFSRKKARTRENVLDVAEHAGIAVLWRDNNSGCKDVCTRVDSEELAQAEDPRFCGNGECRDEILLRDLQGYIDQADRDVLIVLHQKGSHGPAYYKRHPKQFQLFQPECQDEQLGECSRQEVVNAYDNSLLYTDFFLSR
ncbi:MAG TPA: phosphoethanolamine transferase domain-containing protein, partial [Oligoflexia bacterium]|nr:phosphoethanolamine transferase domain-containing protein [Oligoflexia bacterium]